MSKRKEQQDKLAAIWATKKVGGPTRQNAPSPQDTLGVTGAKQVDAGSSRKGASPLGLLSEALINVGENKTSSMVVDEIVVIPSERCLPSFIRDRFDFSEDPDFISLKESIESSGQQLPILVRPHPTEDGCYQIAFGHRRHRACQELSFPVRAVVRNMSDEELVIAQGKENNEREDLTFIEMALFASHLRKNFPRRVVISAIGKSSKNYISMLATITEAIPERIIKKIGKAKGVGRPRWEKLASYFAAGQLRGELNAELNSLLETIEFDSASSPKRFDEVLGLLEQSSLVEKPKQISKQLRAKNGGNLGEVQISEKMFRLTIKRDVAPEFADYLSSHLEKLIADFENEGGQS